MIRSDMKDMNPETKMVTIKIVTTQRIVRLCARLSADGSGLDTKKIPFIFNGKDGGKQDKSYGLGRVGFPRTEPAVAEQAVSVSSIRSGVADS